MTTTMVARVQQLLLNPREAWPQIAAEPADAAQLYRQYLLWLAAIPAVCGFVGFSLVGVGAFGITVRVPLLAGLAQMLLSYALSLVGVWMLALTVQALAPHFGGEADRMQALKLAVYASTAALLGGVFSLLPALAMLGVLAALYSVYLLYTGLPVLMRSPQARALPYTAVVVVAAIVLGVVLGALTALLTPSRLGAVPALAVGRTGEPAPLDAAGRALQAAAAADAAPGAAGSAVAQALAQAPGAVDLQALKDALPARLGGLERQALEVHDGAALGLPTRQARAHYGSDARQVALEITDLGGLAPLALLGLGAAQGEREDATTAEKTWQEGGRTWHQRADKDGGHAEFKVVLRNAVVVALEADRTTPEALRQWLGQVNLAALEALPRKPQP